MATNVTVYDLENYPDNSKTVTVDQSQVVPVGYEGDEQWVLSFVTSAYSDNTNTTAIQDIYVQEIRAGWAKSSGLVGTGGKFTLGTSSHKLGIKMDASSQYYVNLDEGTNITGDGIAADMEVKIRAIPSSHLWSSSDDSLAYKNASVEYEGGKFKIISGSVSPYYTGANRSSVNVTASGADTCYSVLGFDLGVNSETIAGVSAAEVSLAADFSSDTSPMTIGAGTGVTVGDCLMITNGTTTDYFTALSGTTDTSVVVSTTATNKFHGVQNNYVAGEAKIQLLREQDPDQMPVSYYDTVDGIIRWGIKSIANQIDFSS